MEFFVKDKTLAMRSKMNIAIFLLAKTFLQSYQWFLVILEAWKRCYQAFGYKFIIHQIIYLGKWRLIWIARDLNYE